MIGPIGDVTQGALPAPRAAPPARADGGHGFAAVLESHLGGSEEVRFSAHALKRLDDRQIALSPQDRGRIRDAVDQLRTKGGRESLVVMDTVALVVSVPNRTVITAVPTAELGTNIFTQIDSAVVLASAGPSARETY